MLPPAAAAAGATTAAGTWAPTADDAKFIEMVADMEDKWQQVGYYKQQLDVGAGC